MNLFKVCAWLPVVVVLAACAGDQPSSDSDTAASAGMSDSLVIELVGEDSVTAFDLLRKSHRVEYRSTLNGVYVTEIDSIENGNDHFWVYTVNDSTVAVAADDYLTADGDRVQWHLRKF